jgi:uncharacterized protein YndB with AHSA1/START domain
MNGPNADDLVAPGLVADGADWVLIVDRTLPHPPEQVWAALTRADQLRIWGPFSSSRDLVSVGPVTLTDLGVAEPSETEATVQEAVLPRLLVLDWGADTLRWELAAAGAGTRLTLRHRFADRAQAASYAAGWHLCLVALEASLNGHPLPSVVGENALDHGYHDLHDGYARLLGLGAMADQDAR